MIIYSKIELKRNIKQKIKARSEHLAVNSAINHSGMSVILVFDVMKNFSVVAMQENLNVD